MMTRQEKIIRSIRKAGIHLELALAQIEAAENSEVHLNNALSGRLKKSHKHICDLVAKISVVI